MTPRGLIEPARLAGAALLHTQTDDRLVDLTRAGNDRAFEAIVSRYRRQLLRYCSRILPPERAEDAVQQAFLNAYTAMTAGEAELKLRPWLYRVAHNAALNLLRQNGWSYDQIPEDFDGVVQPPQAVEQKEHIRQVVRNVKDLPERQRDAIVLRELEGRSYEEIAVALGVSDGAVRQLLNRARTTLRAAASAITPPQLLERLVERAGADAPAAARIAELSLGAGGAAALTKFGAAFVIAGAVAGGVAAGPLEHRARGASVDDVLEAVQLGHRGTVDAVAADRPIGLQAIPRAFGIHRPRGADSVAGALTDALVSAGPLTGPGSASGPGGGGSTSGPGGGGIDSSGPGGGGSSGPGGGDGGSDGSGSGDSSGPGGGSGDGGGSGSSGPGDGSGSSGSGSGSSGSGSSGSGSDSSGSGSGSSDSGSGSSGSGDGGGSSGSGSGSSDSGSSGSGSSDSGSSGSGDSGSGGGDTSGSGTSGSGSGSSGPG